MAEVPRAEHPRRTVYTYIYSFVWEGKCAKSGSRVALTVGWTSAMLEGGCTIACLHGWLHGSDEGGMQADMAGA